MKMYNGRFNPFEAPKGKLKPKQEVFGRITAIAKCAISNVQVKCLTAMSGALSKQKEVNGSLKEWYTRHNFFDYVEKLYFKMKSKLIGAKAAILEYRKKMVNSRKSRASAHWASDLDVASSFITGIHANLIAYRRSVLIFLKKLYFSSAVKVDQAKAAVFAFAESRYFHALHKLEKAKSALCAYVKKMLAPHFSKLIRARSKLLNVLLQLRKVDYSATGSSAQTNNDGSINTSFAIGDSGDLGKTASKEMKSNRKSKMQLLAGMTLQAEPMVSNGVLLIRQAYDAVLVDGVLDFTKEWEDTILENGILYIKQVDNVVINNDILEVS